MADATGDRPRLNPAMIVLGVLILGALLFWAFLCVMPSDNRVIEDDSRTGVTEAPE